MMDRFANDVEPKTFLNLLLGQQYCQQNANVGPRITAIWEFICEGALKHSQDPKNFTAVGPRPPLRNSRIRHCFQLIFTNEC